MGGTTLFSMATEKETSNCLGCCRSEYVTKADFYPSLLATRNKERHYACCCCNTVVCGCCFPKTTTATLGLGKPGGDTELKTFVCDGDEALKQKALEWVYGGIAEGAEEYHCAAHLRDADLIKPGVMELQPPTRH